MGQALPQRHPAVVLRSHHRLLQALLAITTAAVIALSTAVIILAGDGDEVAGRSDAGQPQAIQLPVTAAPGGARYDGGPDEGTRGPFTTAPDPGYKDRAGGPRFLPQGPGGARP